MNKKHLITNTDMQGSKSLILLNEINSNETLANETITIQEDLLAIAVILYKNVETDKFSILEDNKGKTGIYKWTHKQSKKIYIGSSVDLADRLSRYFTFVELKRMNSYISRAILHHGHSAFSLDILEYIDISNIGKKDARKLILEREQYFLNIIFSQEDKRDTYNILKTAGSSLGFIFSPESRVRISESLKGKEISSETRAKMSVAKSGENHPHFGKVRSSITRARISAGHKGKQISPETRAKISLANGGGIIFVYGSDGALVKTFLSRKEAAKFYNCSNVTISNYIKNGKLLQNQWILSLKDTSVSFQQGPFDSN